MNKTVKNVLLFLGLVIGSALLAPILYRFLDFKFKRILSRCLMISIGFFTYYIIRQNRIDWRQFLTDIGFEWSGDKLRLFWRGFIIGASMLAATFFILMAAEIRFLKPELTFWMGLRGLVVGFLGAVLIGVLEGLFFQGVLFRKMVRKNLWFGFLGLSFFYAALHFFHDGNVFVEKPPDFIDSFRLIFGYFHTLLKPFDIWPGLVGLFIFGLILCLAFYRTGIILFSMGIHAGCVFVIKFGGEITRRNHDYNELLFGTDDIYNGALAWILLTVLWFLVFLLVKKRSEVPNG